MKKRDEIKLTHPEPHSAKSVSHLNWLRASVLGANDGIVSIAGLVIGVAGATNSSGVILTAGLAGIIAGAISMAAGEYVSVSSSRDTEKALLRKEKFELQHYPQEEFHELVKIYEKKGLSRRTAIIVAKELTAKDAFKAHVDAELGIDPDNLTNPWHAAFASALSFIMGAVIPLLAILLPPAAIRIPVAFLSVIVALAITGILSAKAGDAHVIRATLRV
ncbi:MAG: VIT family protein, partial [Nitrososphaeria archaeon]